MFGITPEQVGSAVRWIVGLAGASLVSTTGISSGDITSLGGAAATIAMIVWSLFIKRKSVLIK